ncbi:hypothetical protein SK128_017293 [Halocaridina rubra]|uniref:Uncharacterized protein n=1 Tax=Halocaridina rubra TaxID=373956 RepID=A0AAN8X3V2_HALRR
MEEFSRLSQTIHCSIVQRIQNVSVLCIRESARYVFPEKVLDESRLERAIGHTVAKICHKHWVKTRFRICIQVFNTRSFSVMMTDIERRAPGCEKKRLELEHQKLTSLSDYNSKKLQAAKAMKEQVSASPRTPTSNWSGYGFSKSMPGFMIRQKMQENKLLKTNHVYVEIADLLLMVGAWSGYLGNRFMFDDTSVVTVGVVLTDIREMIGYLFVQGMSVLL